MVSQHFNSYQILTKWWRWGPDLVWSSSSACWWQESFSSAGIILSWWLITEVNMSAMLSLISALAPHMHPLLMAALSQRWFLFPGSLLFSSPSPVSSPWLVPIRCLVFVLVLVSPCVSSSPAAVGTVFHKVLCVRMKLLIPVLLHSDLHNHQIRMQMIYQSICQLCLFHGDDQNPSNDA